MLTVARGAAVVTAVLVAALGVAPHAAADGPACEVVNPSSGTCTVWAGGIPAPGGGATGTPVGGGGGSVPTPTTVDGVQCYPGGLTNPQPAQTDPVWQGPSDGHIYDCLSGASSIPAVALVVYRFWAATPPAVAPRPDPRQLAHQATDSMQLHAITVGIVPE